MKRNHVMFIGCFNLFMPRRWLFRIAGLLLLWVGLPAQAMNNYIFPTKMPNGCTQISSGNYACGALTFDYHDTITIASPKPTVTTITVTGSLETNSTTINPNGLASELHFVVTDNVTLGYGTTLAGSITTSISTIKLGQLVVVDGNIKSTTGTISVDYQGTVGGSITSTTGSITLGQLVKVSGSVIASDTGAIAVGNKSQIAGPISGTTGGITVGQEVSVGAGITSTTGFVTVDNKSLIGGDITTSTGPITVNYQAQVVGSVNGTTGGITLNNEVKVGGSITSTTGFVIVGYKGQICGGIDVSTGYVTLEQESKVGGSISGTTGPVTIKYQGKVVGSITTSTGAVSVLQEAQVGGNITTTTGAVNIGYLARIGGGVTTTTGAKVYDPTSKINDTTLTMTPVCSTSPPSGSKAGLFECLASGSNSTWSSTARKPLFTRLVNTPFSFDVAALKLDGTLENNFVASGGVAKSVTVELVNGAGSTACTSRTAIGPAVIQTLAFTATDRGRKAVVSMNVAKAYPDLRCRVTDTSQSPSLVSCSSDNFSVRPGSVTLVTTPTMATPPSATSSVLIKAGASFTLRATTTTATTDAYNGLLSQDSSKLAAQTSSQDASLVSGSVVGTLSPSTLIANATPSNNASYDEVGYLYLDAGAYRDTNFTAVDQVGDCVANSTSVTASGGLFGCDIGNEISVSFGRFYPDHFAISATTLTPACVSGTPFSYFGQDGFTTTFSLSAKNVANGTTQNYSGAFAKFNPSSYLSYGFSAGTLPAGSSLTSSAAAPSGIWVKGVTAVLAKHQINRPTAPSAEVLITVSAAPTDGEVAAGAATAVGSTPLRYGRLAMQNVYGSELLPLPVPLEAQYWTGNFYVTNKADSCTVINLSSITMRDYLKQLNACETQISPVGNVTLVAGKLPAPGLVLSKPGTNNGGSVELVVNLGAAPTGNSCVGPTESAASAANMPWFGLNPHARATFGIYKSHLIYRRENY